MVNANQVLLLQSVVDGLAFHTVDNLKRLLQLLPVEVNVTRKDDLISLIANQVTGKPLQRLWQDLDELQQAAVAEAVHLTGGNYQRVQFAAKYGETPDWGEIFSYRPQDKPSKLQLFFYPTAIYGRGKLYMPLDLQAELKHYVPQPKALVLASSENPPGSWQVTENYFDYEQRQSVSEQREVTVVCCETEQTALQELVDVLRLVQLGKVSVSDKTFMPTKASLNALQTVLKGDYYSAADVDENEEDQQIGAIKPVAWVMLLQAAKLVSLEGKKLKLTPSGQKALTADRAKTLKTLWQRWLKATLLDELRRVDSIKGQTGKGKRGLTALSHRRSAIAQALTQCPPGQWVLYDDLQQYLIASNQTFEVSRHPEHLSIGQAGYGNFLDTGGHWSILEDSYMRGVLFEYAATLGLLDIAYISPYDASRNRWKNFWGVNSLSFFSRYDGLQAIRLTPLGAFCLGLVASYEVIAIATQTTVTVSPTLEIIVTRGPLQPSEALLLDTFAHKITDTLWQLDDEITLKATAAGHSLKDFQTFLQTTSSDSLPEPVNHFFEDCLKRSTRLQDRGLARLIECQEAALATLIAHDPRTQKYCYLAGEQHLVVPLDQENQFRTALRKLGFNLPLS